MKKKTKKKKKFKGTSDDFEKMSTDKLLFIENELISEMQNILNDEKKQDLYMLLEIERELSLRENI